MNALEIYQSRKQVPARVALRQVIPTLRALWYGGAVVLNAEFENGALVVRRNHSLIMETTIRNTPIRRFAVRDFEALGPGT